MEKMLAAVRRGEVAPVYLLFGERFLCRDACASLLEALLPGEQERSANLESIDGDREDLGRIISLLKTYNLFSGRKVVRVMDTRLLHSREVAKTLWGKAKKAWSAKEPELAFSYLHQVLEAAGIGARDLAGGGLAEIPAGQWQKMLGFAKPDEDLDWAQELLDRGDGSAGQSGSGGDPGDSLIEAVRAGLPGGNVLVLVAEAADKRKRLYKFLLKEGAILDLAVDPGPTAKARKDQETVLRDLILKTLAEFDKKLVPQAVPLLLERVGFHPVALVRETEKLALFVGEAETITTDDLEQVIGRTREDALYEFNEAVGCRRLEAALGILSRMDEHGVYPLVIVAALRNHLRKLLEIRCLQGMAAVPYPKKMAFPVFRDRYLPELKSVREELPDFLGGHPYALYNLFGQAEMFSPAELKTALVELLEAEFRLKGSEAPARAVMENLLFRVVAGLKES